MRGNRGIGVVLVVSLAGAALVFGLNSCGDSADGGKGESATVGGLRFGITARFLNPHDSRDATYIAGQPPPANGLHFAGVFVEVENETDRPEGFPTISLTDAAGAEHAAYPPGTNPYLRHFGETVKPHETQPARDLPRGPPVRSLLLFKLTPGSEKRPFTLHIGSEEGEAKVTLDL
jgi:hypothetical protein